MAFKIGARASIRLMGSETTFFGEIMGLEESVIVTVQMEDRKSIYFGPHKLVEFCVYGGNFAGVSEGVTLSERDGLVQLQVEPSCRMEKQSRLVRHTSRLPVRYGAASAGSADLENHGFSVDLSIGGIAIEGDSLPPIGSVVKLVVSAQGQEIFGEGVVRNHQNRGEKCFGVEFKALSRLDLAKLTQLLRSVSEKAA